MLNYKKALKAILRHSYRLKAKALPLGECLYRVLAQDLYAPMAFPNFDNSAVDGYAIGGLIQRKFKVQGEIPAGKYISKTLKPGEARQIFTGAPVPKGTKAVVMQEHTERRNGTLHILKTPRPQDNIRFRGEEFRRRDLLIKKGTKLEPAHLALMAAVGLKKARVFAPPEIAVVVTGSELSKGGGLRPGKIYDSNSILLEALIRKSGAGSKVLPLAGDNPRQIRRAVREGLGYDILIISGGVSVGKYDFVKDALAHEGVKEIFWKVNIKPGKPLYFGKRNKTLVFGLPGNPVSVFVTFEEFVKPALMKMSGKNSPVVCLQGRLSKNFQNGPRLHFIRVSAKKNKKGVSIIPLKGQGPHQIAALARANAILKAEPDELFKRNQTVKVKMIHGENL